MHTKLLILGAGCSASSGYPLAANMFEGLAQFAKTLSSEAQRLRALVEKTLTLAQHIRAKGHRVETLDTLAKLLHEGAANGKTMQERNQNVKDAKLAVTAYFLSLERPALQKGLPGYSHLIDRIFGSASRYHTKATQDTPYRVLSFNYDRLFELAFRQRFRDFDDTVALYSPAALNSGLRLVAPALAEVKPERFCFLKLHGSVDLYGIEEDGRPDLIHGIPDPDNLPAITDAHFFLSDEPGYEIYAGQAKPALIVFPNEKAHLETYRGNMLPFREYLPAIWSAANAAASQAEEIRLIGNSCPDADAEAFRSLFAAAANCRRYVIENPSPAEVCNRLRPLLSPDFSGEVLCETLPFAQSEQKNT